MDVDSPPTTRTTPHLLKIYVKPSSFHPSSLFYETKSVPTEDQYELFCWEETTLQGIVQGLVGIVPEKFRAHQGNWSFRSVEQGKGKEEIASSRSSPLAFLPFSFPGRVSLAGSCRRRTLEVAGEHGRRRISVS